jgi:hypothetical protein
VPQVELLHLETPDTRFETTDVEQLLDQAAQPIGLIADRTQDLLLLGRDVSVDFVEAARRTLG